MCLYPPLTQTKNYMPAFALPALTVAGLRSFFKKHPLRGGTLSESAEPSTGAYSGIENSNPYENYDYKMGPFEGFLRSFGFRTKYDQYKEQMAMQAKETDFQVENKKYDEAYNDPSAQAARERAAGLNPDLLGTSGVEAASALPEDGNPIQTVPGADIAEAPGMFANFILSGITAAVGLSKDVVGLRSLRLANENQEIANAGGVLNFAFDALDSFLPSSPNLEDSTNDFYQAYEFVRDKYKGQVSRKTYKKMMSAMQGLWSSAPREASAYKSWSERITNRQNLYRGQSSSLYSDMDDVLLEVSKELNRFSDEAYKIINRNSVATANLDTQEVSNQLEYESQIDPSSAAAASNAQNALTTQEAEIDKAMNDSLARIVKSLERKANSGERGADAASAALLVFSALRSLQIKAPSMSYKRSVSDHNYNSSKNSAQ